MSGTSVARAKVLQLGICITFCIMVFSTLARYILDANNRTRCESMLNEGDWLDDDTYKQWQPPGCMMHIYRPDDVASCLNHSRILYIGDSIARQQFFSFAKLINNGINTDGEKHIDRKFEFAKEGLTFEFWWDPYLNSTRTVQYLQQSGVGVDTGDRPSLLVVGTGSWHMRYLDSRMYMEDWQKGIDTVLDAIQRSPNVADAVILSPVEIPDFDHLSSDRALTITKEKVAAMNNYLASQQQAGALHAQTPFMIESSHNVTEDGLHYDTVITETQVQLALNYRCNDVRPKHFPYAATCCFHYPSPRWYQNIFFALFLIIVPVGLYFCDTDFSNIIPSEKVLNALFVFGLGVIYMYFGDRTQLFGKMHKNFDSSTFMTLMMLFVLLSGMITLKTAKKENVDLGFLNRDQTDEWKGWMQVIILIYHFMVLLVLQGFTMLCGSSSLLISSRLAMLLFYSSSLILVLCDLLDNVHWTYEQQEHGIHGCKNCYCCSGDHCPDSNPWYHGICFDMLQLFFNIRWNAMEWRFRLSLDGFIVYVGMISAFVYIKCLEHKWMDHLLFGKVKLATLIGAGLAMVWYFWFELTRQDKFAYNQAQPYISWIPILAFVFLRNATVRLRNTSSRFLFLLGRSHWKRSLDNFTCGLLVIQRSPTGNSQQHMGSAIYHCKATGDLSQWICNDLLLGKQPQQQRAVTNRASPEYQAVPLLPTSTLASSTIPTSVQSSAQTSTSNESLHVQPDTGGGSGIDSTSDPTKFVTMDEDEDEEHGVPMSKPHSLGYRIITDPRFKVITFLLGVGILNRLS
ncbi:10 TM acyl transferase domain found in Cas1p-domain-containing protein [Absidia repens]|uniref:10 TM acyl transferase domain found in Cas1p-domain-containing protein n=1 Tax=Absidia repens TaxID=90262 RepID=A0A1X2IV50_9FUNG|nr:10 TM acyl transferase domain found in Cas1p-domain-containing protein [Absidia repens]